jgi:hypothetical protein
MSTPKMATLWRCSLACSFVLTLKKGRYTYQFGQYAWTHMILMVSNPAPVQQLPGSFFLSGMPVWCRAFRQHTAILPACPSTLSAWDRRAGCTLPPHPPPPHPLTPLNPPPTPTHLLTHTPTPPPPPYTHRPDTFLPLAPWPLDPDPPLTSPGPQTHPAACASCPTALYFLFVCSRRTCIFS